MNRAELRRIEREKTEMIQMSKLDYNLMIQRIKDDVTKKATEDAFVLMLGIPVMVLHDKYDWRKVRLEKFNNEVFKSFEAFQEGRFNIKDVKEFLKKESDVTYEYKNYKSKESAK